MGKVFSAIGSIFGAKQAQQPSISGRDILASSEAKAPESAVLGGSDILDSSVKGKEALKIKLNKAATTGKASGVSSVNM
jgi:hypothetical protein